MNDTEGLQVLRARVLSIQPDIKALFAVVDDADLPDSIRQLAVTAIFYALNPSNLIPASEGLLGSADDAIAIRCAFDEIWHTEPAHAQSFAQSNPEAWASLDQEIPQLKALLGDLWQPFTETWKRIGMNSWRGKKVSDILTNPEEASWLYSTIEEEFALRDFDESAVVREVRKEFLLARLQTRLAVRKKTN